VFNLLGIGFCDFSMCSVSDLINQVTCLKSYGVDIFFGLFYFLILLFDISFFFLSSYVVFFILFFIKLSQSSNMESYFGRLTRDDSLFVLPMLYIYHA